MSDCTQIAAELSRAYSQPLSVNYWSTSSVSSGLSWMSSSSSSSSSLGEPTSSRFFEYNTKNDDDHGDDDTTTNNNYHYNFWDQPGGILLTMCTDPILACGARLGEDHIAASWIHQDVTGVERRFVGDFGLVFLFDPVHSLTVECMYPADGSTDQRTQRGCGVVKEPSWFQKLWIKIGLQQYKNDTFPNTPWQDIPCREFFAFTNETMPPWWYNGTPANDFLWLNDVDLTLIFADCNNLDDYSSYRLESGMVWLQGTMQKILGHVVCRLHDDDLIPGVEQDNWLLFYDACHWEPHQWTSMLNAMRYLEVTYPKVHLWNEIVLNRRRRGGGDGRQGRQQQQQQGVVDHAQGQAFRHAVKAVFYIAPEAAAAAHLMAWRLGGKPVLRMKGTDQNKTEPLFQCPPKSDLPHGRGGI